MNTTARKGEKTVEKASPYLINNTYSTVIANVARPIGPFDEEGELKAFKLKLQAEKDALEAAEEASRPPSPGKSKGAASPKATTTPDASFAAAADKVDGEKSRFELQ